jgi:hypothetical protein
MTTVKSNTFFITQCQLDLAGYGDVKGESVPFPVGTIVPVTVQKRLAAQIQKGWGQIHQ